MIIDVNAYLGHFAFRRLRHNTADGLLQLMDSPEDRPGRRLERQRHHLPQPAVGQRGGGRRGQGASRPPDPVRRHQPVVRRLGGRPEDLPRRVRHARAAPLSQVAQLRALRPRCLELVHAATERGMVVSIPIRVEDPRERSWLVDVPDLPLDDVAALVRACPQARFLHPERHRLPELAAGQEDERLARQLLHRDLPADGLAGRRARLADRRRWAPTGSSSARACRSAIPIPPCSSCRSCPLARKIASESPGKMSRSGSTE